MHIGLTDWNLEQTGKLDNVEVQARYLEKSHQEGIPLDGTCLDILHINKAGVILGLEETISAEDNVRIMDRVK